MYLERMSPAGDLDARLFELLRHPVTAPGVDDVPAAVHDFLRSLAAAGPEGAAPLWSGLAERLAQAGLPLAGWVAFQQALRHTAAAAARAPLYQRRAAMLDRHGFGLRAAADRRNAARMNRQPLPPGRVVELEEDGLAVVSCQGEAAEFARFAACVDSPLRRDPLRDPGFVKASFFESEGERWGQAVDLSFFVVDSDNRPLVQVECDALGDDMMACRNSWIVLTPLAPGAEAAFPLAARQLLVNAHWMGLAEIGVQVWDDDDSPVLRRWLGEQRVMLYRMRHASVALDRPMDRVLADFRQTHRNLVRWGLANLCFLSSFTDPPQALVQAYRHLAVTSGRGGVDSEAVMLERVRRGQVSLHVAVRDGVPETAVVVSYCADVAYYAAAARTADQRKSSAPALMYRIMAELRERGVRQFVLGDLPEGDGADPKWRSIAAFKAGFTKTFRTGQWARVHSAMTPSCLDLEG